ncbi:uncharacterized protein LOC106176027 [Lingula anatina]|uniref:Uncharacterized protein LOC106176027 n=1 Tax=Lingula anatina TaxID=7574 RepID=A0A1S3JTM3_LINAN|nr:uncharacterized protein LOC106176027 [Lingula anatina]|eukprot:XP_013413692.1 uncharacterized protein LOC106176027 [Lingula anatina]
MGTTASTGTAMAAGTTTAFAAHALVKWKTRRELTSNPGQTDRTVYEKYPELTEALEAVEEASQRLGDPENQKSLKARTSLISYLNEYVTGAPLEFTKVEERSALATYAAEIQLADQLTEYYMNTLEMYGLSTVTHLDYSSIRGHELHTLRLLALNYSDASMEFATRLVNAGFLRLLLQDLSAVSEGITSGKLSIKNKNVHVALWTNISILHNCAKWENCKQDFQELDAINILLPYKDAENQGIKAAVIMTLAYIVEEENNHILTSDESVFDFMISLLTKALEKDNHHEIFWADELAAGLEALAKNEDNKPVIVRKGALPLLTKMLSSPDETEVDPAVSAIWELSFNNENKTAIKTENECLDRVKDLIKHRNPDIAQAADSIFWELDIDVESGEEKGKELDTIDQNLPNGAPSPKTWPNSKAALWGESASGQHIMISYNWDNQPILIKVKDALVSLGYKVWMDIEQMRGSTSDAMSSAVENAAVVLIAMSQKYKDSKPCRKEAEYADEQNKAIIPLLVQPGYKPNGWLGLLVGKALYYDISGKFNIRSKVNDLATALGDRGKRKGGVPAFLVVPDHSRTRPSSVQGSKKAVQDWGKEDVIGWLKSYGLEKLSHLASLTGEEIGYLQELRIEAPEFFHSYIFDRLAIKHLRDMKALSTALKQL